MKLKTEAQAYNLNVTLEFIRNGIIAHVPREIPDQLSRFGIESADVRYNIDRSLITTKEQLLKLVSDKYDEFYKK